MPAALLVRSFLGQRKEDPEAEHSTTSVSLAQPASTSIAEPPFLRHPILFDPNSVELNVAGKNAVKRAATWLREHADGRVLIVGSCDTSGSEFCTHALAEARGAVIRGFLENSGVRSGQVVGVKGWDNDQHSCRPTEIKCQQLSRNVQIFLAASVPASEEKP